MMDINMIIFMSVLFIVTLYAVYKVFTGEGGTKGIKEEYTSPSGKKRTATKDRGDYIV